MALTATYTVETHVLIINNRTNGTRTSTITNTDIDFAHISTPTNTNSAGTVTSLFTLINGKTVTATFPSILFDDYTSTYAVHGTLPTVVNGASTCLTIPPEPTGSISGSNGDQGVFFFPSHPPLSPLSPLPPSLSSAIDLSQDPRGWTYYADSQEYCDGGSILSSLFPDLGVWSCSTELSCAAPAMVLETALYLTATSISYDAGPLTSSGPGPATPTSQHTRTPVPQPAPNASTRESVLAATGGSGNANPPPEPTPVQQPAPNQQPFPTEQPLAPEQPSARESVPAPTDGGGDTIPLQPAPLQISVPDQQHSPTKQPPAPEKPFVLNQSPAIVGQPFPNPQPSPPSANTIPIIKGFTNEQGSFVISTTHAVAIPISQTWINKQGQPTTNPQPSPPFASIIPITTSFTNERGSLVTSTTHAVAISILQTLINSQGQTAISTDFSAIIPNPPITLMPEIISSTNADESVFIATSNGALVPVITTSTNAHGQYVVITSTSFSPVATNAQPTPIALIATTLTTTNAQGIPTVSTNIAAIVPILFTSTNQEGQVIISTSMLTAEATASTNLTITTTNAQGSIISFTTGVPAITFITTDAHGSQIITTSSILLPTALPIPPLPRLTIGTQAFTPNSANAYIIGSQMLTPGGVVTISGTIVSFEPDGTAAIVGTSTEGLGGLITAGLGNGPDGAPVATTGFSSEPFTGRAGAISSWLSPGHVRWVEGFCWFGGLGLFIMNM